MEVVFKFFYSSCMKYLKLILLSNNIQNIGYLKGHPFIILIQKLYIVFLLLWIVFLWNCPFLVK